MKFVLTLRSYIRSLVFQQFCIKGLQFRTEAALALSLSRNGCILKLHLPLESIDFSMDIKLLELMVNGV